MSWRPCVIVHGTAERNILGGVDIRNTALEWRAAGVLERHGGFLASSRDSFSFIYLRVLDMIM